MSECLWCGAPLNGPSYEGTGCCSEGCAECLAENEES
jgi:hypothetical protein